MISIGTCGFPKSRAEVFDRMQAVEIQESFYRHVEPATARRWRDEAPKGFLFAVKASQFITHDPSSPTYRRSSLKIDSRLVKNYGSFKPTREVMAAWRRTEETCGILDAKAVVFQTPSSFEPTDENIENLDKFLSKAETDLLVAWEPRGDWPDEVIRRICEKHGAVHCVDPLGRESVTPGVAYFRLHGKPPGGRMYYYSYSDEDLRKLAGTVRSYDEAFVLFNNVSMFADASRFRRMLNV